MNQTWQAVIHDIGRRLILVDPEIIVDEIVGPCVERTCNTSNISQLRRLGHLCVTRSNWGEKTPQGTGIFNIEVGAEIENVGVAAVAEVGAQVTERTGPTSPGGGAIEDEGGWVFPPC